MKLSALFTPDRFRLWLMVLLVGLLSLGSYWILEVVRNSEKNKIAHAVRTDPDYFVEQFNFLKMTSTGQSKYRIAGNKLLHYPGDDSYEIILPVITNLSPLQDPMDIHAQRAIVNNKANQSESEVHLYGNVIVDRPQNIKSKHVQLRTEYLLVYPDKDVMQTDKAVELTIDNIITTGVGMHADNKTQQIQIFNNVTSIIPPHPRRTAH